MNLHATSMTLSLTGMTGALQKSCKGETVPEVISSLLMLYMSISNARTAAGILSGSLIAVDRAYATKDIIEAISRGQLPLQFVATCVYGVRRVLYAVEAPNELLYGVDIHLKENKSITGAVQFVTSSLLEAGGNNTLDPHVTSPDEVEQNSYFQSQASRKLHLSISRRAFEHTSQTYEPLLEAKYIRPTAIPSWNEVRKTGTDTVRRKLKVFGKLRTITTFRIIVEGGKRAYRHVPNARCTRSRRNARAVRAEHVGHVGHALKRGPCMSSTGGTCHTRHGKSIGRQARSYTSHAKVARALRVHEILQPDWLDAEKRYLSGL
ncbi:hypothetical protein FGB62_297g01 [Gracilaria domingensis]|nr:hypothetical protein FGB62_297g01 [Gracilaria domingensis]